MAFNTAVSGLRAAGDDLSVIGNNIANASTTGFKQSRANFADVYAASSLGSGGNQVGSGVLMADVSQQFSQGNISFTNNGLDLAINGNGFFRLENNGATEYTRAGVFGLDADGFIVSSNNSSLLGFQATDGVISDTPTTLQISTENLPPQQTTAVETQFNLDAGETAPAVRGTLYDTGGAIIGDVQAGGTNGYRAEIATITLPDTTTRTVTTVADASANATASLFAAESGIATNPSTTATISAVADNGGLVVSLNGVTLADATNFGGVPITAQDIAVAINNLTNSTLPGITAVVNGAGTEVAITANTGDDLTVVVGNSGDPADGVTVSGFTSRIIELQGDGLGDQDTNGNGVIDVGGEAATNNAGLTATIGGTIAFTFDEDITMDTTPVVGADDGSGLFETTIIPVPFVNNQFDATDQDTYNHATSVNVFDSQGNSHVMTMYFVKESDLRTWTMHVQIDGQDVGDPNTALTPPLNTLAQPASFELIYNDDGSLNTTSSDEVEITYWNPLNSDGEDNGSRGPLTAAERAAAVLLGTDIVELDYSNFTVDLDEATQFGASFGVNDMSQDGFTVGRLADVDITSDGQIFTRFTNGQSQVLGQVALANFNNVQGLQPLGDSAWSETFLSGEALLGTPGSAALGVLQSGALEESNVDLSQELVGLIIAQRNFQANAKTIETADAVTQAIINLR
ncbi:MAG: flagellar hook-basal body complex protein [Pseudomonadales bacterium]|nr:flagellar hook-basal body complex protein [Pseudomonadales bacterium]